MDFESHYLAESKIDSTLFISNNISIKFGWSDTIGYVTYDSLGRILTDAHDQWGVYKYAYDSIGLKTYTYWRDWDIVFQLNATHDYLKDSLILYEYWTQGKSKRRTYTCRYKFNHQGMLIEEIRYGDAIVGGKKIRLLEYDLNNRLIREKIIEWDIENKKELFYSTHLDSVVNHIKELDKKTDSTYLVYKTIDYYDINGLKTKTVKQDSLTIRYTHFKKG